MNEWANLLSSLTKQNKSCTSSINIVYRLSLRPDTMWLQIWRTEAGSRFDTSAVTWKDDIRAPSIHYAWTHSGKGYPYIGDYLRSSHLPHASAYTSTSHVLPTPNSEYRDLKISSTHYSHEQRPKAKNVQHGSVDLYSLAFLGLFDLRVLLGAQSWLPAGKKCVLMFMLTSPLTPSPIELQPTEHRAPKGRHAHAIHAWQPLLYWTIAMLQNFRQCNQIALV
jgi:hypothetical protein